MLRLRILFSFFVCLLVSVNAVRAQQLQVDQTPQIHRGFPFQTMWDDAVMASATSKKPTVAFDLDLIDSASIKVAQTVIGSKRLQMYLHNNYEVALNDFASDPPSSVGLDSLRNLGWRLSGLEKNYGIVKRPCIIVIGPNKAEIDRIVFPQTLNAIQIEQQLGSIMLDRNTLHSNVVAFWKDTTNLALRWKLIDLFEIRSKYDSVVSHLYGIKNDRQHKVDAEKAAMRLADLKLHVEGKPGPTEEFISELGPRYKELQLQLRTQLLAFYKQKKNVPDVERTYDALMKLSGKRDPDMLNEEAWFIANESSSQEDALKFANEALAAKPKDPNFYDTRALIYSNMHRFDEAIHDEETAVSLSTKKDKKDFMTQLQHIKDLKEKVRADEEAESKEDSRSKENK